MPPPNEDRDVDLERAMREQAEQIELLCGRLRPYSILSTLPYPKIAFWNSTVQNLPRRPTWLDHWTRKIGIDDITLIARLLRHANGHDLVLLTGGERGDLIYLALAGLLPWIKTPHIIVDAHWQKASSRIGAALQRLILRMGDRLTRQVQPHSEEEVELYHDLFAVPFEKLHPIPWSTSLIGYDIKPSAGDFILTGGESYRDYDTFARAIAPLDLPVEIGLPRTMQLPACLRQLPPHVRVHTTLTNLEYMEKVAGCRIFAMPIVHGINRCTADRAILNAMHFGKIVVATDSIGSRPYIRHGINGFLVPEGDPAAMATALRHAFSLGPEQYGAIARQAEYDAKCRFNEELRCARILMACLDLLEPYPPPRDSAEGMQFSAEVESVSGRD